MRLRTAKDRLKIEHSIIDGVRGHAGRAAELPIPAIRSVIPGVIRPVRDARGKVKVRVTVPDAERLEGHRAERRRAAGAVHQHGSDARRKWKRRW